MTNVFVEQEANAIVKSKMSALFLSEAEDADLTYCESSKRVPRYELTRNTEYRAAGFQLDSALQVPVLRLRRQRTP